MSFFRDGTPRVIGHRGSPRRALENTFDSFDLAESEGADGFELDVRLTADGEPVVLHDPDVVHTGGRSPVHVLGLIDLLELTAVKDGHQGKIPTLRDVLLRYGGSGRYLIELKPGPSPRVGLLEFRVANLLTGLHLVEKALVLSFSGDALRRIKEIEPAIETCLNFDGTAPRVDGALWPPLPKGCRAIAPQVALVSDELFRRAAEQEIAVHPWTVNDPELAAHLARLGAASVITDVPSEIGPAVRAVRGRPSPLELLIS